MTEWNKKNHHFLLLLFWEKKGLFISTRTVVVGDKPWYDLHTHTLFLLLFLIMVEENFLLLSLCQAVDLDWKGACFLFKKNLLSSSSLVSQGPNSLNGFPNGRVGDISTILGNGVAQSDIAKGTLQHPWNLLCSKALLSNRAVLS